MPESIPPPRRPTFDDVRDDYDDAYADRGREVARRRMYVPGLAHVVVGTLGLIGTLGVAGVALFLYLDNPRPDPTDGVEVMLWGMLAAVLAAAFVLVIAGGAAMLTVRRRALALAGAYALTGLSLAGCYAILFYPFGIWALVVLYQPDVREQFGRPPPPWDDGHGEL